MLFNVNENTFADEDVDAIDMELLEAVETTQADPFLAAVETVYYTESNYNKLCEAIYVGELTHFAESGNTMVYEAEGKAKAVFDAVIDFFKSILKRIKGIFIKMIATLTSWVGTDKAFVAHFRKLQSKGHIANKSTFVGKGFTFSNLDHKFKDQIQVTTLSDSDGIMDSPEKLKAGIEKYNSEKEGIVESIRGARLSGQGKITKGEFKKECFKYFRSGKTIAGEINTVDIEGWISEIETAKDSKKAAKDSYDSVSKVIKAEIKRVEQLKKAVEKKDENRELKMKYAGNYIALLKADANTCTIINGAHLKAIAANNRQARRFCVALVEGKGAGEKKAVGEGASYLSQIQFD